MAQYRVPQDVEAEDKLLGPFTFRQFIYLLIAAGLIAVAFFLFKIFPLLAIIPVPPVILLLTLALPLKKDQPMETYLAAVISFYTKPHKRLWEPGEPESTIIITAPKKVEEKRTKEFNSEEASHRLSFLAEIVDTEGYAIKGSANNTFNDDFVAEANNAEDIFDISANSQMNQALQNNAASRHDALVAQMRQAIDNSHNISSQNATINRFQTAPQPAVTPQAAQNLTVTPIAYTPQTLPQQPQAQPNYYANTTPVATSVPTPSINLPKAGEVPIAPVTAPAPTTPTTPTPPSLPTFDSSLSNNVIIQPDIPLPEPEKPATEQHTGMVNTSAEPEPAPKPESAPEPAKPAEPNHAMVNLANNKDFSIETIAKQANRINKTNNDGEVYISLH